MASSRTRRAGDGALGFGFAMLVTLLYSIAGGTLVMVSASRIEQVAWPFLRLLAVLSLALTVGPTAWMCRESAATAGWRSWLGGVAGFGAIALIFLAPRSAARPARYRFVAAGAAAAALTAACWSAATPYANPAVRSSVVLGQIAGALLLGSITSAWLLGHAYLTATSMTIEPLRRLSRILLWAVVGRAAYSVVSFAAAGAVQGGVASMTHRLADSWLIVSLRVGAGLIGVGVFAYLVADCVRLRATQSATGILYFGSVMAYVGELASLQLTREIGWAL